MNALARVVSELHDGYAHRKKSQGNNKMLEHVLQKYPPEYAVSSHLHLCHDVHYNSETSSQTGR